MILSSAMTKIMSIDDVAPESEGKCLTNQGFQFQAYFTAPKDISLPVTVTSDLAGFIRVYRVREVKGKYDSDNKNDDYYVKAKDDMYPDLLVESNLIEAKKDETVVLFIDISEHEKPVGTHFIEIGVGNESARFKLDVVNARLLPTDLIVTHWLYADCICDRYGVKPFGREFYEIFDTFIDFYVRMGNNTILLPAFTVPLDTAIGAERTTTQLVTVEKVNGEYLFDFSAMKEFIDFCKARGVIYFEHSHLFTQWGAEFCPKIIVREDGREYNAFGWAVESEDARYTEFLRAYFNSLGKFLREEKLEDSIFIHVSDEPEPQYLERYKRLSKLVKRLSGGLKTMDAMSSFEIAQETVDIPVVSMNSPDLPLFDDNKMLYYCVGVDNDYITNHFLHMPLQRTEILGMQLYENNARGFLNWAFNFYNARLSTSHIDPYSDTTSGGGFTAGDAFLVYPGEKGAQPSLRYFALKRAFEDYRLLKTAEAKTSRPDIMNLLHDFGMHGVHEYPRSIPLHELLRTRIMDIIAPIEK